jgi:hypothetical protein
MISFIIGYILGIFTGLLLVAVYVLVMAKKSLKALKVDTSVKERMLKVKELTEQQLSLQQQTSMPQKNALDGKYKNGLIKEIEFLEEQKIDILKSIVKDGHDPEVTALTPEGETTRVKLSAFLAERGIDMRDNEQPKNKFTVIPGGKGEGGETVH